MDSEKYQKQVRAFMRCWGHMFPGEFAQWITPGWIDLLESVMNEAKQLRSGIEPAIAISSSAADGPRITIKYMGEFNREKSDSTAALTEELAHDIANLAQRATESVRRTCAFCCGAAVTHSVFEPELPTCMTHRFLRRRDIALEYYWTDYIGKDVERIDVVLHNVEQSFEHHAVVYKALSDRVSANAERSDVHSCDLNGLAIQSPKYLRISDVDQILRVVGHRLGWDVAAVEDYDFSSIATRQQKAYESGLDTISALAAAVACSVTNVVVSFALTDSLIRLNGWKIAAAVDSVIAIFTGIDTKKVEIIGKWLGRHLVRIDGVAQLECRNADKNCRVVDPYSWYSAQHVLHERDRDRSRRDDKLFLLRNENAHLAKRGVLAPFPADAEQNIEQLQRKYPNGAGVIDEFVRAIGLARLGCSYARLDPILIVGPAGSGKTQLTTDLAKIVFPSVMEISFGQLNASFELCGVTPDWDSCSPSRFTKALRDSYPVRNIAVVGDEIDKGIRESGRWGNPYSILYGLLETHTARRFCDNGLETNLDLSMLTWLFTSNELNLPEPLLSRMTIVQMNYPSQEQMTTVVGSVWSSIKAEHGWGRYFEPELSTSVVTKLVSCSPRDVKKRLRHAAGRAVERIGISQVRHATSLIDLHESDLPKHVITSETQRRPIGFMH